MENTNHSRVVLKKTLVAIIIGLLFFVSSETILAVQRPPYPIKAEQPDDPLLVPIPRWLAVCLASISWPITSRRSREKNARTSRLASRPPDGTERGTSVRR